MKMKFGRRINCLYFRESIRINFLFELVENTNKFILDLIEFVALIYWNAQRNNRLFLFVGLLLRST